MTKEAFLSRNRTHDEIRRGGAIGNLNDGLEIAIQEVHSRLIAWPGNGFQTMSVHVLTLKPGDSSRLYSYAMAEEAMLCLKGKGEVFLRERWLDIEAGDIAFFPPGVEHGARTADDNDRDFVLVSCLSPPPFDLYEPAGYYDKARGCARLFGSSLKTVR